MSKKIQIFQNKTLCLTTRVPLFVSNQTLRTDLNLQTEPETAVKSKKRYHKSLPSHSNILAKSISDLMPGNPSKRLKKKRCRDLLLIYWLTSQINSKVEVSTSGWLLHQCLCKSCTSFTLIILHFIDCMIKKKKN